jgi:acyl-CoA thioester hydrolase
MNSSFELSLQQRFNDFDMQGHLNASSYFTYFETARLAYTNVAFGVIDWSQKGMVIAHQEMNYKKPVFFTDQIVVRIGLIELGTSSIKVGVQVVKKRKMDEIVCAEGSCVLVSFDNIKHEVIPTPQEWIDAMETYEKRSLKAI